MPGEQILSRLVQASPLLRAVGEELSFTRAAARLNVDQSAVSHRVKSLEGALGRALFERTTRRLAPTEAGEILFHAAKEAMAAWETALNKLERSGSTSLIQLTMPSSLALKWLIPALPRARARNLDISIEVKDDTIAFKANEADAAIRFGPGPYPGLHSTHLSHSWLQPVANASYLRGRPDGPDLLNSPDVVLLADRRGEADATDFSWACYREGAGSAITDVEPTFAFDRADLMLQAAVSGMGVGLGRTLLIENDLEAGFLASVGPPVPMRAAYWLVCPPSFAETNRHQELLIWLKEEIQRTKEKTRQC